MLGRSFIKIYEISVVWGLEHCGFDCANYIKSHRFFPSMKRKQKAYDVEKKEGIIRIKRLIIAFLFYF